MKRLIFLSVAILLLFSATDLQAGPCDAVDAQSVRFFAANMTPVPSEQNGTTAEEPLFLATGEEKDPEVVAMGCSSSDCQICNNNRLTCKPVTGDCCCV